MTPARELMCSLDGPEVAAFKAACVGTPDLGLLLDHGSQPRAATRTTAASSSTTAARSGSTTASCIRGCRSSRGSRATSASRCATGPNGVQARADHLPRRHVPRDGARGAYKGAEIIAAHRRLHGADPPRLADHQPGQRVLQPDAYTRQRVHVRQRRHVRLDGRRHVLSTSTARVMVEGGGRPDEIITAEVRPDLVREARARLGRGEQHLPALPPRLRRGEGRRAGLPLHLHARHGGRPLPAAVGSERAGDRRHVVRLRAADARTRRYRRPLPRVRP